MNGDELKRLLIKIKKIIDGTEELKNDVVDWDQALVNDEALTEINNIIEEELAALRNVTS